MHRMTRLLASTGLTVCLTAGINTQAFAQSWPQKPIRLINPFAAGGSVDFFARLISPKMSEILGQPVVVEARPGASGMTGVDSVAKSAPDGYSVIIPGPSSLTILPHLTKTPYSVENDLALLTTISRVPNLITVNGKLGINTLEDLVKAARQAPGKLNYGSSGSGGTLHLGGALLAQELKINIVHIPYKGVAPALTDLVGGQVQILVANANVPLGQIKGGTVKALAITSPKRSSLLPDVPSVAELGMTSLVTEDVFGLAVPTKTPQAIQDKLLQAGTAAVRSKEVVDKYAEQAALASASTPQEYRQWVQTESARWAQVIKQAGIVLE